MRPYFFLLTAFVVHLGALDPFESTFAKSGPKDCSCVQVRGEIGDCNCTIEAVNQLNRLRIYPLLNEIVKQSFFRFYKVNLKRECPFWQSEYTCSVKDCQVKKCAASDLPAAMREEIADREKAEQLQVNNRNVKSVEEGCEDDALGKLNTTLSDENQRAIEHWSEHDFANQHNFCEYDDDISKDNQYVDLLLNPERFTGYQGKSAWQIWRAIYEQNCFSDRSGTKTQGITDLNGMCLEERVFYRAISGLQSSIAVHLTYESLLPQIALKQPSSHPDDTPQFGPNVCAFAARFSPLLIPEGPSRLKNLYFLYLLELRAFAKVAPYLRKRLDSLVFTGDASKDAETREQIRMLLLFASEFKLHFDETPLTLVAHSGETRSRKAEFRENFRNVTRIMDCVDCEKCRLWGKLQVQGLGTALKILFSDPVDEFSEHSGTSAFTPLNDDADAQCSSSTQCTSAPVYTNLHVYGYTHATPHVPFQLRRNELVALFNAFRQLSKSLYALDEFEQMLKAADIRELCPGLFAKH